MIDSHTHFDHKRFDNGREEYLARVREAGVQKIVNAAISFDSNYQMRKLLDQYDWIYYGMGIHPNCAADTSDLSNEEKEEELRKLLAMPNVVAVGETGLDFHRNPGEDEKELQREWFHRQIRLALETNLPLIIHVRGEEAEVEVLDILKQYFSNSVLDGNFLNLSGTDDLSDREIKENSIKSSPGVIHCFRGDKKFAGECLDMGFYLGIGGCVTWPQESVLRASVEEIPLERILLETDCPFLVPQGHPDKRNSSESLPLIVREIAGIKNISEEEVIAVTTRNAEELFHI